MNVNRTITKILLLQQAGKNWGSVREKIFARLLCRAKRGWGGKRQRILRQQKGKAENFSSLEEKLKKEGRAQKMKGKIFYFARRKASAAAGRVLRPSGRRIIRENGSRILN